MAIVTSFVFTRYGFVGHNRTGIRAENAIFGLFWAVRSKEGAYIEQILHGPKDKGKSMRQNSFQEEFVNFPDEDSIHQWKIKNSLVVLWYEPHADSEYPLNQGSILSFQNKNSIVDKGQNIDNFLNLYENVF